MFLDKYKYAFLGRMRRAEGLPPKVNKDAKLHLGAQPSTVYEISLSISLALTIAGFKFFPAVETPQQRTAPAQELVSVEDVEVTRQQERPPAPVKPPVVIEAPADEILSDAPIVDSEISEAPPPAPKLSGDSDEEYFIAVEDIPQLVGGITKLLQNLVYPELAIRAGMQGRVTVVAYVNENGDVVKAEVLKGIGLGCDEAAVTAVKKSKFIPGKQRGKPVKTRISIPVEFRLTN